MQLVDPAARQPSRAEPRTPQRTCGAPCDESSIAALQAERYPSPLQLTAFCGDEIPTNTPHTTPQPDSERTRLHWILRLGESSRYDESLAYGRSVAHLPIAFDGAETRECSDSRRYGCAPGEAARTPSFGRREKLDRAGIRLPLPRQRGVGISTRRSRRNSRQVVNRGRVRIRRFDSPRFEVAPQRTTEHTCGKVSTLPSIAVSHGACGTLVATVT